MVRIRPRFGIFLAAFVGFATTQACGASSSPESSPPSPPIVAEGDPSRPGERLPAARLPAARFDTIVQELVRASGAPGAVVAVGRGEEIWSGAFGIDDVARGTPMRADGVFRAGSITKMFVGVAALRLVERHAFALDAKLAGWAPTFPNAAAITVDMLLTHTAGVTTEWFDRPALQAEVTANLFHVYTPSEVIALVAPLAPRGAPATSMAYSNAGYVLLGEGLRTAAGDGDVGALIAREVIAPLDLTHTAFRFDDPPDLLHGYFDYAGTVLDAATAPQVGIVSFAGAAGAIHATAPDLVRFLTALFETEALVTTATRSRMMAEGAPGSAYGRATMAFCPCAETPGGTRYAGFGHGGHLPGHWSLAIHYPDKHLSVAMMMNADTAGGAPLDRAPLDVAARAIYDAIP